MTVVRVGILFSLALFVTVTADPCCRPTQWTAASVVETVGKAQINFTLCYQELDYALANYKNLAYLHRKLP